MAAIVGTSQAGVISSGKLLRGRGYINEVMRDTLAIGKRWLGGTDLKLTIDRHGIATDNLALEALRQIER